MLQKHVLLVGKDIGIWPWKSRFNSNSKHVPHIITHRCMVGYIYTYELIINYFMNYY